MLYQSIALFLGVAAVANAQITFDEATGKFKCAVPQGTYCAGDSLTSNIIVRCDKGVGYPGNCNDNLAGIPPIGVKTSAMCYQSSKVAADGACSFNGIVYPDNGGKSFPVPAGKPSSSAYVSTPCTTSTPAPPPPSSTPCSSSSEKPPVPKPSSTPCDSSSIVTKTLYPTASPYPTPSGTGNNGGYPNPTGTWSPSATPSSPGYTGAASSMGRPAVAGAAGLAIAAFFL